MATSKVTKTSMIIDNRYILGKSTKTISLIAEHLYFGIDKAIFTILELVRSRALITVSTTSFHQHKLKYSEQSEPLNLHPLSLA